MSEKVYSRVKEAEEMIAKLCRKQPDALWSIQNPNMIAVYGIENKEKGKKNKVLATIHPIRGSEKFVMSDNNIPIRYLVELYWSDWREWSEKQKQWVLFHELLHIHHDVGKTVKHDIEDFKLIVAYPQAGVNWFKSETLPDLLNDDVRFDLSLRPSMEETEEEEKDEIDENEPKKQRGRPKGSKNGKKDEEVVEKPEPEEKAEPDEDVF